MALASVAGRISKKNLEKNPVSRVCMKPRPLAQISPEIWPTVQGRSLAQTGIFVGIAASRPTLAEQGESFMIGAFSTPGPVQSQGNSCPACFLRSSSVRSSLPTASMSPRCASTAPTTAPPRTGTSVIWPCWPIPAPPWWWSRPPTWSGTAASPTAAWGSIPITTRRRLARVIAHCRRSGTAKLGIQLAHAGRKASSQRPWEGGGALKAHQDPWQTIAPSAIAFGENWHTPAGDDRRRHRPGPRGVRQFGQARGADRLRPDRAALRPRLSGAFVLLAARQQAHRPVRRLAGEPHAVRHRDRARGAGRGAEGRAARRAALGDGMEGRRARPPTRPSPIARR